jgi:hypothetical protein
MTTPLAEVPVEPPIEPAVEPLVEALAACHIGFPN